MRVTVLGLIALLSLAVGGPASAGVPPEVEALLHKLSEQRAAISSFSESFTVSLFQWGLDTFLGRDGLVLDRRRGSVPGVRQVFVPGLLLRDGVLSCDLRLTAEDQGYLVFRAHDDADAAYQFLITSRLDGGYVSGFVKKGNLDQLYGGARVGQSFRDSYPPDQWLRVEVYFQGSVLLATVDGQPAAYYDRAEIRDGSISILAGARPLAVRNLAVTLFQGGKLASPYRPPRRVPPTQCEPRVVARPTDDAPAFAALNTQPPGVPGERPGAVFGLVPGAGTRVHYWRLDADDTFTLDNEPLVPLRDTDGLYFARLPQSVEWQRAVGLLRDDALIARIRKHGLSRAPVRVRLVDYVNALATDHEFGEDPVLDGKSRLLEIAGRRCRVTSARRWHSSFAYTLRTDTPLAMHLLVAEMPYDRERYPCLRIQPPDATGGDPDYGVGAGTYTGRGVPADGLLHAQTLLFTPRGPRVRFTVSRVPAEERDNAANGAAVSQVFLFALLDQTPDRPNPVLPLAKSGERTLALAAPSARALLRQRGALLETPAATAADRAAGYRCLLHYLRFLGFNALDVGVLDVDAAGIRAEYSGSRIFSQTCERGLFTELLPLAAQAGIQVTPVIPPLPVAPQLSLPGPDPTRWLLVDWRQQPARGGAWPFLNPLHPEAPLLLSRLVEEISRLCAKSPAVREIALRVEGDQGGCIPAAGGVRAEEWGYAAEEIARFASETGIDLPPLSGQEAYQWLRANAWERWLEWRCDNLTGQWLLARNTLRARHSNGRLRLKLAVPDRALARPDAWFEEGAAPLDLMRAHGVDPRALAASEGVVLEPVFDVGYDRVRAAQHRENVAALDTFCYQPEWLALFKGKEPAAVEVSLAPWEEHGQHLGSEFFPRAGGHWGASTLTPAGRLLFRPLTHLLRTGNPFRLSLHGVELATAGREPDWRRFARAYRALPPVAPAPFDGLATLQGAKPTRTGPPPLPADLVVRRYGDRVGIINDSAQARVLELHPARALQANERWVELASGETLARGTTLPPVVRLTLELDPYDVRVLAILPDIKPVTTKTPAKATLAPEAAEIAPKPTPAKPSEGEKRRR